MLQAYSGPIVYITTVIYGRVSLFTRSTFVIPIIDSLNFYRYKRGFALLGYVLMPDHLHLLLWPSAGADIDDIMRDFKTFTSKRILRQAEVEQRQEWLDHFAKAGADTHRSEHKVWQDSFWDVNVFTDRFLRQKLNYIHRNPLRAGLVETPDAYPYSSYRNYMFDDETLIEIDRII